MHLFALLLGIEPLPLNEEILLSSLAPRMHIDSFLHRIVGRRFFASNASMVFGYLLCGMLHGRKNLCKLGAYICKYGGMTDLKMQLLQRAE